MEVQCIPCAWKREGGRENTQRLCGVNTEDVELIDSVMRAFVTTYIRPEDVNGGEESNEVSKCS